MELNNNSDRYYTTDLPLVALLNLRYPIADVAKKGTILDFGFERSADLLAAVRDYQDSKAKVEPQAYYNQLRQVRTIINKTLNP